MAAIRSFIVFDTTLSATGASTPLTLALSRKSGSYLLVYPTPQSPASPNERQYSIINALVASDPFPDPSEGTGRVRIWLKIGAGKKGEEGGENDGLLEKLVEAKVVADTGIKSTQGMISYPLVEILIPPGEFCHACATCGAFENALDEPERFKRAAPSFAHFPFRRRRLKPTRR
ncbi:hypothetical protein RQP46_002844 [Phenoliferia psychrophenolica]